MARPFPEDGPSDMGGGKAFPPPTDLFVATAPPAVPADDQAPPTAQRVLLQSVSVTRQCVEMPAPAASVRTEPVEDVASTVQDFSSRAPSSVAPAADQDAVANEAVAAGLEEAVKESRNSDAAGLMAFRWLGATEHDRGGR